MSSDLSVIVFSKDRPLQLHGYLSSLLSFSNLHPGQITVLYKDNPEFSYDLCKDSFPNCCWVNEESFSKNFLEILANIKSKYVMFGCDDVVFTRPFSFDFAIQNLERDGSLFTFSLRVGKNTYPHPQDVILSSSFLKWSWGNDYWTHWIYPWELDASVYRVADVRDIVSSFREPINNPNFLEANFYQDTDLHSKYKNNMPYMMSSLESKLLVITVNRVQETHLNSFDDCLGSDVKSLDQKYRAGFRLDFMALRSKIMPKKIHVDSRYLLLNQNINATNKLNKLIELSDLFHQSIYSIKFHVMNPLRFLLGIK